MALGLWERVSGELTALVAQTQSQQWWIALSGGRDSMVLLDLLHRWGQEHPEIRLQAVHVNHGLHPSASEWVLMCRSACEQRSIPLTVKTCRVQTDSGLGLEASARQARYRAFKDVLAQEDVLLLAHHANDQAETILYRLLRGSGPRGLAGMPKQRVLGSGQLVRPLLQIERELIEAWASAQALPFVDDPSNLDTRLDRNFLRSEVLPVIASRWPSYVSTLLRAGALQQQALADLNALPLATGVTCFNEPLLRFSSDIQHDQLASQLHRWLTLSGHLAPSHRRLRDFAQQALTAQADRRPELRLEHYRLCRWRNSIVCAAGIDQPGTSSNTEPPGTGALPSSCVVGEDIDGPWGRMYWRLSEGASGLPRGMLLQFRYRQEGERLTPLNGRTKPYGQLCQERNVPPWWRHQLPLFTPRDSAVPLFAPALGQFAAMSDWSSGEEPLLLPFWGPPNGDSSIEPPPPNW